VTDYGIVTAVGEGTTTITLTVGNDVTYAVNTTNVTVTVSKIPTEITVDTTPLDLFVGDEIVIVANLTPAGAGNVTFTSSDYDVVDFDFEGNVIAQGKGQAIITVSFAGDDKYAAAENKTIIINVSLDNASVTVDNNTLDLKVGETSAINATKHPDTIMLDITYTSSNNSVVTVDKKGIVTAVGEGTAVITVEVGDDEIYAKNSTTVNVTVSKVSTEIESSAVTTVYNVDKNLIVTLKDANGKPIRGANITVDLNGEKTYTTDKKGQITVSTKGLAPKAYTAKITFNGNSTHDKSTKDVKVTVKKATPKITAKAKTFKTTTKTKKYVIVLKNNVNKPIKKATVYLKVNGKTYKATTNSKGKATFKITKLNKAGKFKATVTYKGNKYYNKATKKVTIKVKSVWKTVSKGSKNSAIVKKIQRALKNHGYYLEYNGRYLMVDGIYWDYTEMAVKEFQNDKVLKVTGKVDEKTAKKLGIIK
uniref:peptidoglycan-binding protein n=1 Tax=uncultured Methanobrevibacter sp. TaxID=253161 RepID=UPI0032082EE6